MTKVGFLGFGKMAMAIAQGWKTKCAENAPEVYAYAPNQKKLEHNCALFDAHPCRSIEEVVEHSEVLILACKPKQVQSVLEDASESISGQFVICLAAGIDNERLESWIPDIPHVSIMPNIAMAAGAGIVVVEKKNTLTEKEFEIFNQLISPLAYIAQVDPDQFSIAGTISGCSPAFLGLYAEALADVGVKYGLNRELAAALSAQAVYGAGSLLVEEGKEPSVFKNEICSPGGTTIKGIVALEKAGFRAAVIEAIEAIQEKK